MKTILVTGGAGFIGSHFVDLVISDTNHKVIVLDKLTYAGKLENMALFLYLERVHFIQGDICDYAVISSIFEKFEIDYIVNFAAESHVDNSILSADNFIQTNIIGTFNLLNVAKNFWKNYSDKKFIQISTDEVYGSLGFNDESFLESSILDPSSPYSSTKASADLICLSYYKTFGFPVVITRSSNNFGPRQHSEKFIPVVIEAIRDKKEIPVYGTGNNVRDWIYVVDNCKSILSLINYGVVGNVYNIGSNNELSNMEIIMRITLVMKETNPNVRFVSDRLGHDLRYSLNTDKLSKLGIKNLTDFNNALELTVNYFENQNRDI